MKSLKIGIASYEKMQTRTMAIAQGTYTSGRSEPKVWFTSIESFARVLSDRNGLVRLKKCTGGKLSPRVPYSDIVLDIPIVMA